VGGRTPAELGARGQPQHVGARRTGLVAPPGRVENDGFGHRQRWILTLGVECAEGLGSALLELKGSAHRFVGVLGALE
jgi:hypothetical protein